MSFSYQKMIRQAALRVSALIGSTSALKQTAYTTSPLTTSQVGSIDFPLAALQDAAISSVASIVRTYAGIANHPLRNYHTNVTDNLATGANIPSLDNTGKSIIGVYGAFRDSTDGKELTEQPLQIIETINSNTDDFLEDEYYYFKVGGRRIYHTRPSVIIDCVCFDEATERVNLASGNTPLADGLFDLAWVGMMPLLITDDSFASQASYFGNLFNQGLSQIANGASSVAVDLINTNNPGVS